MNTTSRVQRSLIIVTLLWITTSTPGYADDAATKKMEMGDWIMNYYLHPDPEHFVERVRGLSSAGMLYDPSPDARPDARVMFLGKIMEANAKNIREWMTGLSSLPDEDKAVLKRAVWYSGTAEGNAWLEEHGEGSLAKGPRPMLLADRQVLNMQPRHLDELWEWFFATGDEKPVARIVSLFSLAHESPRKDSLDLLPPPVKPVPSSSASKTETPKPKEGEVVISKIDPESLYQLRMSNYVNLKPALWSTTSLAIQQDRVLEMLKKIERTHYHAGIRAWLGQIIKIAEFKRAQNKKN